MLACGLPFRLCGRGCIAVAPGGGNDDQIVQIRLRSKTNGGKRASNIGRAGQLGEAKEANEANDAGLWGLYGHIYFFFTQSFFFLGRGGGYST